jgi:outer membrane receptor for monomeric catechols
MILGGAMTNRGRAKRAKIGPLRVPVVLIVGAVIVAAVWGAVTGISSVQQRRIARTLDRLEARARRFAAPAECRSGSPCFSVSGCDTPSITRSYETSLPADVACARLSDALRTTPGITRLSGRGAERDDRGVLYDHCYSEASLPEGGLTARVSPAQPTTRKADSAALVVRVSFVSKTA